VGRISYKFVMKCMFLCKLPRQDKTESTSVMKNLTTDVTSILTSLMLKVASEKKDSAMLSLLSLENSWFLGNGKPNTFLGTALNS
jgi:hypothetical protein